MTETIDVPDANGGTAADGAWSIAPRTLPAPMGASEHVRRQLASEPTPVAPVPESRESLEGCAAQRDAEIGKLAQQLAAELGVTITNTEIAGVLCYEVIPPDVAAVHADHLFVHVHGGAWMQGGGLGATAEATEIAALSKLPVLSIDYRMLPDHPAPAAVDDVAAVWQHTIAQRPASSTALGGTSAGANIVLSTLLRLKSLGVDLPGAVMVGTPACEIGNVGDMRHINDGIDHSLVSWDGTPTLVASHYAAAFSYDDPEVSPIYGDFTGFPPAYLISGTRDIMLSDTVRTHRKLRQARVQADLHVYEGLAHADYILMIGSPEQAEHYAELSDFLTHHL